MKKEIIVINIGVSIPLGTNRIPIMPLLMIGESTMGKLEGLGIDR